VDLYVVIAKVTRSPSWAGGFSMLAMATLAAFWFVYPAMARRSATGK
jgi:hypothetical protein